MDSYGIGSYMPKTALNYENNLVPGDTRPWRGRRGRTAATAPWSRCAASPANKGTSFIIDTTCSWCFVLFRPCYFMLLIGPVNTPQLNSKFCSNGQEEIRQEDKRTIIEQRRCAERHINTAFSARIRTSKLRGQKAYHDGHNGWYLQVHFYKMNTLQDFLYGPSSS